MCRFCWSRPHHKHAKLQQQMKRNLLSQFRKQFDEQAKLFRRLAFLTARSSSKDHVHDLRVCSRRLRAMLWILKKDNSYYTDTCLLQDLKTLTNLLGEQRELDIAIEDGRAYRLPVTGLLRSRHKTQRALQRGLHKIEREKILAEIQQVKNFLHASRSLRFEPALRKLDQETRHWKNGKLRPGKLHEFRISTKRIRYALEAFGLPVKPLQKLQDHLGDAHDLEILSEVLGKHRKVKKDERKYGLQAIRQAKPALTFAHKQFKAIL